MIWIFVNVFLRDWCHVFAHPHFFEYDFAIITFS
mgnify:CR=1 FL=1